MSNPRNFSVAALGFEDNERRLLRNVLQISEHRAPAFVPFAPQTHACPQIVIVNGDKPQAMASLETLKRAQGHNGVISAVVLSRKIPEDNPKYWLTRPILATRLFALLERVVTEEHGFEPALAIQSENDLVVFDTGPQPAAPPPEARTAAPMPEKSTGSHELAALVVDDSLPVRVQMRAALERIAKHVDFAETGEDALGLIESRRYDVVFLDVILPGLDGYEVCKRIRKSASNQRTPVVMLTSNSSPADRIKGKLAGCDTYLIKPVREGVFEEVIREFVQTAAAA
jgi:twitching motility two-component system response regulator PilG